MVFNVFFDFEVWKCSWWMMMYGSPTPKRSYAYANAECVRALDLGWKRLKSTSVSTVEKYVDGKGNVRYKGSAQLKSTE